MQPAAEQYMLPDNLEVQKTGILAVKFVTVDGKRANSRSWRGMGAVLSREMLFLVKDKKENANMVCHLLIHNGATVFWFVLQF